DFAAHLHSVAGEGLPRVSGVGDVPGGHAAARLPAPAPLRQQLLDVGGDRADVPALDVDVDIDDAGKILVIDLHRRLLVPVNLPHQVLELLGRGLGLFASDRGEHEVLPGDLRPGQGHANENVVAAHVVEQEQG